jgi:hypothetical protein
MTIGHVSLFVYVAIALHSSRCSLCTMFMFKILTIYKLQNKEKQSRLFLDISNHVQSFSTERTCRRLAIRWWLNTFTASNNPITWLVGIYCVYWAFLNWIYIWSLVLKLFY